MYVKLNFVGDVFFCQKNCTQRFHEFFSGNQAVKLTAASRDSSRRLLLWVEAARARARSLSNTQWFQMAKNRWKKVQPKWFARVFPCKFLLIYIISVSSCLPFTFKICETVAGTSMIHRFHEFFESLFGGFFEFGPTVSRDCAQQKLGGIFRTARARVFTEKSFLAAWLRCVVVNWVEARAHLEQLRARA